MIGLVRWACVIALILLVGYVAARTRKQLGRVDDRSMANFFALMSGGEAHVGIANELGFGVAYLPWLIAYTLFGSPETSTPPVVEEKVVPPDFDEILGMLKPELRLLHPDMPGEVLDAFMLDARDLLEKNLSDHVLEGEMGDDGREARRSLLNKRIVAAHEFSALRPLREAFSSLWESVSKLSSNAPSSLRTPIIQLLSDRDVSNFFWKLVQRDVFLSTYTNFALTCRWADKCLEKKEFEPSSPKHVALLIRDIKHSAALNISVALPEAQRFEGTWIVAPRGRGKTTLLSQFLKHDLDAVAAGKARVIIMDSKGDLIEHVRQLKLFARGEKLDGKLTLIEPSERLALNPLDLGTSSGHTIDLLEYVFTSLLKSDTTTYQGTLLRKVLAVAKTMPYPTLRAIKDMLLTGQLPDSVDLSKLHEEDRDFFARNVMNVPPYKDRRGEVAARIDALTSRVALIRDMFNAPRTKIDMTALMDTPGVLIIDNNVAQLSDTGSEFFSRFFVALILAAAQQRAGRTQAQKLPVYVYMDEADTVIANDEKIPNILNRCRSQNIAMIFAHQGLYQIDDPKVKSALADCSIRIANPGEEAKAFSESFGIPTETLKELPKGRFALFIRDYTKTAITVHVPNDPVSGWPKMTADELDDIRRDMQERYTWRPEELPPRPEPPTPPPPAQQPPPREEPEDSTPKKWKRPKT